MANVKFMYGTNNFPEDGAPGTFYVKRVGETTRGKIAINTPEEESKQIIIGGDVYVGDPGDAAAEDYDVVINPDGDVLENIVTGIDSSYQFKVVEVAESELNNFVPTGASNSTITFVVKTEG